MFREITSLRTKFLACGIWIVPSMPWCWPQPNTYRSLRTSMYRLITMKATNDVYVVTSVWSEISEFHHRPVRSSINSVEDKHTTTSVNTETQMVIKTCHETDCTNFVLRSAFTTAEASLWSRALWSRRWQHCQQNDCCLLTKNYEMVALSIVGSWSHEVTERYLGHSSSYLRGYLYIFYTRREE